MKPNITVLDGATLGKDIDLSVLDGIGNTAIYPLTDPKDAKERLAKCDVCIVNKVKLTAEILSSAKNLKLICETATGYDNIDTDCCLKRGIAVCNVAGYSVNSVSQTTLAMVLSASVKLENYRRAVADGSYTNGGVQNILTPTFHEIAGKTWGIIGYGAIGRKVAQAAGALGCNVIVNKRTTVDDAECVSLETLLKCSDIISIHTPLTNETYHMIGEKQLEMMKDGVFIVNVARGAVMDEEATAKAVENGKIGFFGCDVYSKEPMPESHPFFGIRQRENVCLTPHMAWGAFESRTRCLSEVCENIRAFYRGEARNRIV